MQDFEFNAQCPKCGAVFPISEAVSSEVEDRLKARVRKELEQETNQAEKKLRDGFSSQLKEIKSELAEKNEKLNEALKNEAALRKKTRELGERERNLDVEVQRKVDRNLAELEESVRKRIAGDYDLKLAERDKQLKQTREQLAEAQRKAEQGSQQLQGEVLEESLENFLRSEFPNDTVDPVPKGVSGADVIQRVRDRRGQRVGTIIWETKRTKELEQGLDFETQRGSESRIC